MSILIKGMEMPEECSSCPLMSEAGYCNGTDELTTEELESLWRIAGRPSWCPLVEIPPHGRLIDADAMLNDACSDCEPLSCDNNCTLVELIKNSPIVIEADYPPSIPLKQVWAEVFGEDGGEKKNEKNN